MKKERMFLGTFFIAGAISLIIGKLGLLGDVNMWTVLVTIMLAAWLVKSVQYKSVSGVLFSIAFLCIVYDKYLGITELTPWTVLGAALLGSIGCSMLYHPKRNFARHSEEYFESEETVEGGRITMVTSFSSSIKYINSQDFKGANIGCSFGGMKVFFDNAAIYDGMAVLNLDVSFAGVELFIPKEWRVINEVNCFMGGIEEKGYSGTSGQPEVRLMGKVSFAGVEIIYV